jgi:uncharacterized protein
VAEKFILSFFSRFWANFSGKGAKFVMQILVIALVVLGLMALELFALIKGLKLEGGAAYGVIALFVLFALPLPYIFWLLAGARQPSQFAASLIVRPIFAWQFNWIVFLPVLAALIALTRIGGLWLDRATMLSALRWTTLAIMTCWSLLSALGLAAVSRPAIVKTSEVEIKGLAKSDDGLKIVHFTDPHVAWWNSQEEICRTGDLIASLDPDLLVVTGDVADHNPGYVNVFAECFDKVRPRLGRFAVIGNHDVYTGRQQVARMMTDKGFYELRGEVVDLSSRGAGIALAGIDDSGKGWTGDDPALEKLPQLLAGWRGSVPLILLTHRPPKFELINKLPAALVLSGHTHGGQLRLPFNGPGLADLTFEHTYGFYRQNGRALNVSAGTGTVGWPFRLFCPAEVSLLILRAPN